MATVASPHFSPAGPVDRRRRSRRADEPRCTWRRAPSWCCLRRRSASNPPAPGRRAALPPRSGPTTQAGRCTSPIRSPSAPGSATPRRVERASSAEAPAAIAGNRRFDRRPVRPRRRRRVRSWGWRRRTPAAASSMPRATPPAARSCAPSSPRRAPAPRSTVLEGVAARRLLMQRRVASPAVLAARGARSAGACRPNRGGDRDGRHRRAVHAEHQSRPAVLAWGWRSPPRAGAVLCDLEFVQFHPTALDAPGTPVALVSEAVRGEGAPLVDEKPAADSWPTCRGANWRRRDIVARARSGPSREAGHLTYPRHARPDPGRLRHPLPDDRRRLPRPRHRPRPRADPGSYRRALPHGRHRGGRMRAAARWKACGPAARRRERGSTAPIVWHRTPCSRRWSCARTVAERCRRDRAAPRPGARHGTACCRSAPDPSSLRRIVSETIGRAARARLPARRASRVLLPLAPRRRAPASDPALWWR